MGFPGRLCSSANGKGGKETYENLTLYAFANARTAPDSFKSKIVEKINGLLK